MRFENVTVTQNEINAEGSDDVSTFKLTGAVFEDGLVQLIKQYNGSYTHHVSYRGNFNQERTSISGMWYLDGQKDTFKI